VFLRGNTKLIVEGVMPDLLHVIPIANNSVLNWVLQCEDTSFGLSFITHIGVLLAHPNHDTCVSWSAYNAGEHCSRCIITRKPSLYDEIITKVSLGSVHKIGSKEEMQLENKMVYQP